MNKPQKRSTKGEGQAELVCLGQGGVVASVHISFNVLFFLSHKNGLLFPLYILSFTYVHYRALNIILFCSFFPHLLYFPQQTESYDSEELPQHTPGSHLLFSVEILLRKPKCLNKSWQHVG